MSCLVHNKRFRSSFHSVINELRKENRMAVPILRAMPRKCCTCNDHISETLELMTMKEDDQPIKFKNLIEQVKREKELNPKLILSVNRFENLIEENRRPPSVLPVSNNETTKKSHRKEKRKTSTSSNDSDLAWSDAEDGTSIDTLKSEVRCTRKQAEKSKRSLKHGTFLFLPYTFDGKTVLEKSDSLLEVAKILQRGRFIGSKGHIALLEKQYDARINMITPKTSKQITVALEKAKENFENLTIHNHEETIKMSNKEEGEWVLIRSKKPQNQTNTADFEQLLDDLTNRWKSCLQIEKRKYDGADNSQKSSRKRK